MATKKTLRTKSPRRKRTAPKPEAPSSEPLEIEPRGWIHDAIDAVSEARAAFDNRSVAIVRGKTELAALEGVIFYEALERIHKALVTLDLSLPEVTP